MFLAKKLIKHNVLRYEGKGEHEYRETTKRVFPIIKVFFTSIFIKTLTNLPFCVMKLCTETECQGTVKVTHRQTPGVKTENFLSYQKTIFTVVRLCGLWSRICKGDRFRNVL